MPFSSLTYVKIVLFSLFSACAAAPVDPEPVTMASLMPAPVFYIQKSCRYFSSDMKLLKTLPGSYCAETKTGVVIARPQELLSFNWDFMLEWKIKPFFTHHQLNHSAVEDSILALNSEYADPTALQPKPMRYDQLVVINNRGKIIKLFSFKKYHTEQNTTSSLVRENGWSTDGHQGDSLEATHVNSFRELFKFTGGKRVLTGYVAYDVIRRKVYLLDKSLKNVVRVIDFGNRAAHDVRQFREGELVYFLNENTDEPPPRQSKIEIYDYINDVFSVLYQSDKIKIVYPACGAVVPIETTALLINYSRCNATLEGDAKDSFFEMVNLVTKKSVLIKTETEVRGTGVSIIRVLPYAY